MLGVCETPQPALIADNPPIKTYNSSLIYGKIEVSTNKIYQNPKGVILI